MSNPKVKIHKTRLVDNYYETGKYQYKVADLILMSKNYEVFDLPLAGIDISRQSWEINDLDDFIFHMNRCKNTSLEYPIILDNYGVICDGLHRLCKAIVLGKTSIKAIRLEEMPAISKEIIKEE